jgi:hypothetical protein
VQEGALQLCLAPAETDTLPEPLPSLVMVSSWLTILAKVAVALLAPDIFIEQVPVPAQFSDQPMKTEPGCGLAVSVTEVPAP